MLRKLCGVGFVAFVLLGLPVAAQSTLPRELDQEIEIEVSRPEPTVKIRLESDETGRVVRGVRVDMELDPPGWQAALSGECDLEGGAPALKLSASKSIGERLRMQTEWQYQDGGSQLRGQLECSLFGRDRWKAAQTVQLSGPTAGETVTETSLSLDLTSHGSVTLSSQHNGDRLQCGGGLLYQPWEDLSAGAVWKAEVEEMELGRGFTLTRPTIEGTAQWRW